MAIWAKREARFAGEKGASVHVSRGTLLHHAKQLTENAANRPHIDCRAVIFLEKDQLRSAVPSRDDMAGKLSLHVFSEFLCLLELCHELLAHLLLNLRFFILLFQLISDSHATRRNITRFDGGVLHAAHLDVLSAVVFLFFNLSLFKSLSDQHGLRLNAFKRA